jgi:DNA mismatch repair protein MutH
MHEGASLLTTAQLKERGWMPALVKKFLGVPAATKPNPHYRSAAPMRLYALARVEACEQEDGWKQAAAKAAARSLVGKTVAARKAAALLAQAQTLPITVRRLPLDTLLRLAIASYTAFHEELLWERGHDYERGSRAE